MEKHPIRVPQRLVHLWLDEVKHLDKLEIALHIAKKSSQWSSNKELLECSRFLDTEGMAALGHRMESFRRPTEELKRELTGLEMQIYS